MGDHDYMMRGHDYKLSKCSDEHGEHGAQMLSEEHGEHGEQGAQMIVSLSWLVRR